MIRDLALGSRLSGRNSCGANCVKLGQKAKTEYKRGRVRPSRQIKGGWSRRAVIKRQHDRDTYRQKRIKG